LYLNFVTVADDDCRGFSRDAQMRHTARAIANHMAAAFAVLALGLTTGAMREHASAAQVATAPTTGSTAAEPGSSYGTAIVLEGAKNEMSGIEAEHSYIITHYPGWRQREQALLDHDGRIYDRIEIVGPKGETKSLYFDITDWFGKLD
jgi:hypothetical protein